MVIQFNSIQFNSIQWVFINVQAQWHKCVLYSRNKNTITTQIQHKYTKNNTNNNNIIIII